MSGANQSGKPRTDADPISAPGLTAPDHICGRMTKWTPQETRDERAAWALEAGQAGHSSEAVAEALGISSFSARKIMTNAGWQWWAQPRRLRR